MVVLKVGLLGRVGMVIQTTDLLSHLNARFALEEDILLPIVILEVLMVQI